MAKYTIIRIYEVPVDNADDQQQATDRMMEALVMYECQPKMAPPRRPKVAPPRFMN